MSGLEFVLVAITLGLFFPFPGQPVRNDLVHLLLGECLTPCFLRGGVGGLLLAVLVDILAHRNLPFNACRLNHRKKARDTSR